MGRLGFSDDAGIAAKSWFRLRFSGTALVNTTAFIRVARLLTTPTSL
jgi:hypothetical protein